MIVANLNPGTGEQSDAGDEDDPYVSLADEVLKAVKSGSAADLADALKAFHSQCESEEDEAGGEYGDSTGGSAG